jgi:hypothetical protein
MSKIVSAYKRPINISTKGTLALLLIAQQVFAQAPATVNLDWSAVTTGQQACVAPGSGPTTAILSVSNANKILYTYALDVLSFQIAGNDAGNLPNVAGAGGGANAGVGPALDCTAYVSDLRSLWNIPALFPRNRRSVPLFETQTALNSNQAMISEILANSKCSSNGTTIPSDLTEANEVVTNLLPVYLAVNANTSATAFTVSFPYQIDNKHWYKFTVRERTRLDNTLTDGTLSWKCGLDDVLTLSIGTMMTTVPYRTYNHQSVPTMSGTADELVVSGNSGITPQGLALLNYKLYVLDMGPQPGLAFSAGPAFKFGGTPSVSTFGWFTGLSISLWRRLYLSGGMHLGQFADYPAGFHNGSVIPPSFGTLTPVTRWSARFAGSVTFQTNSFVKSNQGTPAVKSNPSP